MTLPACPARFAVKKAAILSQLARPDEEYSDASPKGAVDEGVRPLLEAINHLDGFVTTSSCAGRVAVFLEGRKSKESAKSNDADERQPSASTAAAAAAVTTASAGGKGGGGAWLFVSHDPLIGNGDSNISAYANTDWAAKFGLEMPADGAETCEGDGDDARLVHFKFEPMILHVLTASPAHAQLLLRCASAAGFRESGAVGIGPVTCGNGAEGHGNDEPMPMVAVRTMGLALASVVGTGVDSHDEPEDGAKQTTRAQSIVSPGYLARLARVADLRFAVNRERTERFTAALAKAIEQESASSVLTGGKKSNDGEWEDAETRRARKRAEGLQRQAALKEKPSKDVVDDQQDDNGMVSEF